MRQISLVGLILSFLLLSFAFMASAEETTLPWKVLRGSPRSATPLQTAEQAKTWLLGQGKADLFLVTSKQDAGKTVILLEQLGAKALKTIRVKPGNMVSEDNGVTWQKAEFRNLIFTLNGQPFPSKAPLSVEWVNYTGGVAYYPAGLDSEWVPVLQGACANLYLWRRGRSPLSLAKGLPPLVVQTPVPPAPPPSPVAIVLLPPPDYAGRAYHRPDRVAESRSVHTVGTIGQVPVPKQEIRISNAGNNTNSANSRAGARANADASANNAGNTNINTNNNLMELMNNILINNTNVNQNVNTISNILQQLQQLVVPIGIGVGG
jgi:hypothetical protein